MATIKTPKRPAGDATRALQVTAKRPSFYRAGRAFGHEPVVVPLAELSDEHEALIRDEPMLVVSEIELPA